MCEQKKQLLCTLIMTDKIISTVIRWVVLAFHSTTSLCRVVCQTRFDTCQTKLFCFIWKWNEWIIEKRLKIMVCELFDSILNRKFTIFFWYDYALARSIVQEITYASELLFLRVVLIKDEPTMFVLIKTLSKI